MENNKSVINSIISSGISYEELIDLANKIFRSKDKSTCHLCGSETNVLFFESEKIYISTCTNCPISFLEFDFTIQAKKQKGYEPYGDYGLYLRGSRGGTIKDFIHFKASIFETIELRARDKAFILIPFFRIYHDNYKSYLKKKVIKDILKDFDLILIKLNEINTNDEMKSYDGEVERYYLEYGRDVFVNLCLNKRLVNIYNKSSCFRIMEDEVEKMLLQFNDEYRNISKVDNLYAHSLFKDVEAKGILNGEGTFTDIKGEGNLYILPLCTLSNLDTNIKYSLVTKAIRQSNILEITNRLMTQQ